jgi:beta-N-acetylhexosaminidase
MALGTHADQAAAVQAIADAQASGALMLPQLLKAKSRLDALASRFPSRSAGYTATQRDSDERLMRRAWAAGLTTLDAPQPPRRDEPLRVLTQRSVPCDGVAEAGATGDDVAALFAGFGDVEMVHLDDLRHLDWAKLPQDGRRTVLVSNHRDRYAGSAAWRPDLHLVLWNPFQALDVAAPAVITWGYASGALEALRAWLEGRGDAPGRSPVTLRGPR